MAVTTKKTFSATTNATTTVFSPVSIQLNNQDDLDVYVTLSGGTRVLQLRQSTGSTAQSSHPQVNNTDGLYFPAVSAGTTLYNYTLSSDNNTITFNSALPSGAVVFCERRTRDADSSYTSFASGSTIRATDLNNSSTESNFTAQDARNKALDLEGSIFGGVQPSINGVAQPFVNSSKIIDGSIATADIADDAVTSAKLANNIDLSGTLDVSGATTFDANVLLAADNQVFTVANGSGVTKLQVDTDNGNTVIHGTLTVNGTTNLPSGSIGTAEIADSQITSAKIADGTIVAGDLASNAVTTAKITDANVTTAKIADSNVTTAKIAADAITSAKIADDQINSEHYVDGSIDTAHIADSQITTAKIADANITATKIASNAVTTDKIADGELTTLAGMQSGTASVLADSTALTASTSELNQLDGITLETSVTTSSDTRIPTSKAVNDLVLSVTNALGGFVAIANETSFPTANPDPSNNAGTVVSISQLASGLAVNSSGVATISNGAGTGNTVTITGFPSSLQSQTLPATSGLQVQTTSTLHTYTFHKQLASAADIQAISATVNSFSNRYRVSASAPTSSLDGGDLWYDTTNSKLMVYSSQNSAWEESSAIGNFFISTISSSSNTGGGSATANGTAYRFTISDAPVSAQQLIVSVDGVIQKPNAGSSQPSEGFVLVGNDIIFGSAPANGASMFVTVIGSTVGIGTPSNNTVTTAILQNGSVTTAKIVDANVTTAKITDANVTTAKIADDAVTADKLANSINSAIAANTAKTTNATHTGDVTGSTSLTIANDAVTTAKIADDAVTADKLANTSVTAASYGSATAIPAITVDAQGRITAASTNTVNTTTNLGTSTATGSVTVTSSTGNNATISEATSSAAGVMSTAHHDKLDGIATSATANPNAINNVVEDTSPQLGGLLDGNGNTANFTANNTGLGIPIGTTANQPTASNYKGYMRFDDTDDVMKYSNGTAWVKFNPISAELTSVTGTIYSSIAGSGLTLAGTGFMSSGLVVNFKQTSDSIDTDVTVTPSSDTAATVAVPAAVYNNVTAGNAVSIKVTNSDGQASNTINKTASSLPTGGTITTSGGYRIHTFNTGSSNFVNTIPSLSIEYLVVAGGGGGGSDRDTGGGGGAGGLLAGTMTVNAQTYAIVVGGGAPGGNTNPGSGYNGWRRGEQGGNTTALGLTAIGGGYGQTRMSGAAGGNGGSGGGGGDNGNQPGGSGTSGQGHDGGGNTAMDSHGGVDSGGGGGAGSAGNGRHPGSGYTSSISGTSKVYSKGGTNYYYSGSIAVWGTDNYGWGGRGGNMGATETYGANGVVIIRYQT